MATVYLAIQESFEREVALKIMSPELAEEQDFSERFLREARIVSKLVHPNIVTVHDVGIENGHHYLSMQYIEGKDLKEMLPEMSAEQIFRTLREVAMALNYAGGKGYVHRDVKPENIMLGSEDGRAILMDFGIARASRPDNSMTRTGTALGTPHYMSPEQARGSEVDGRSDLYSLGVLLYYMLIGKVPFEADSPVAVGIKHLTEPIPTLPAPLACYQPLINKLMAKKPEQRYQTGKDFCDALDRVPTEPLQQWHQRKEFKFHSEGHDTPVRNTGGTELDIDGSSKTWPVRSNSNRAAREPSASDPEPEESLHIPREDLAGRMVDGKSRSRLPWLLLLLAIAAGGAYYFFPSQAQDYWRQGLALIDQWRGQSVPAATPAVVQNTPVDQPVTQAQEQESAAKPAPVTEPVSVPQGKGEAAVGQTPGTTVAPSSESNPPAAQQSDNSKVLDDLRQQIATLAVQVKEQPQQRGALIDLYRQVLEIDPKDTEATEGLETQKANAIAEVKSLIDDRQLDKVQPLMITVLSWFPDLEQEDDWSQLQQSLDGALKVQSLLKQAKEYVNAGHLLSPADGNAVASYRAVLALESDNATAKKGLADIAERYRQMALKQQKQQAFEKALALVSHGLTTAPENTGLKQLQARLKRQLYRQKKIRRLLAEAGTFVSQGKLFAKSASAAQRYLAVLAIDSNNAAAAKGLHQLLTARYHQVEENLDKRHFKLATSEVEEALAVVPKDERLLALSLEIESSKPAIDSVRLSGSDTQSTHRSQAKSVTADRTLYIAFHYKNLTNANTVFQAQLFDGSRSLQIANVPVVVTGSEGSAKFQINRPVEGFTEGGYHIDILLAGQRIYTQAFTIANN